MNRIWLDEIVRTALEEDIGPGDLTVEAVVDPGTRAQARIYAKAEGVIAGTQVAARAFQLLDPEVHFQSVPDGTEVAPGDIVADISGEAAAILSAERVALNFLQRLSGIATETARAAKAAAPYGARIVDTRKTTPGLRALEKAAVRAGGGGNHRLGLYDAVLLKENHIALAGGIGPAVARAKERVGHMVKIEVEVESLHQVEEALAAGVDAILLDNMSLDEMRRAVEMIAGRAIVEASGGITPERVAEVASCGVDVISLGSLTHSARALDLSLLIEVES